MKKIMLVLICIFTLNNIVLASTIFSDYKISFGKVYLTNYIKTIYDDFNLESIESNIYFLNDSGSFHIHDSNGREIIINIINGTLDGKYEELHINGNIYTTGYYNRGNKEGEWLIYEESGKILRKYNYKNNKLNGEYIVYFPKEEKISEKGFYKENKLNGKWTSYHSNGNKKNSGNYIMGKRNGSFIEWYSNGNKKNIFEYVNGISMGKNVGYYENGNILYEFTMNNREGKIVGYNVNKTISFEGEIKNSKRIGKWRFYNTEGKFLMEIDYSQENEGNFKTDNKKENIDNVQDEDHDHSH